MSSPTQTPSEPSRREWRPAGFDPYEASLEKALEHARRLLEVADRQTALVRAARSGDGPIARVHSAEAFWLTLSGKVGTGKTMAARALFSELQAVDPFAGGAWLAGTGEYLEDARRPRCLWFHANDFIDETLGGNYSLPEWLGREWVVVIDDLGAHRETREARAADAFYRLANARLGKLTIFTTNLTQAEIHDRIDPRLQSRMIRDGNVFHRLQVADYAMSGRPQR